MRYTRLSDFTVCEAPNHWTGSGSALLLASYQELIIGGTLGVRVIYMLLIRYSDSKFRMLS
jgi:hypothetical protein